MSNIWVPFNPDTSATQTNSGSLTPSPPKPIQTVLINLARATPLHRGAFRKRVVQFIMRCGGRQPIDITFRGQTFRLYGDANLIEHGIMVHPRYNKKDIDFLCQDLPTDGVFIDIGCNIGLYSLPLADVLGDGGRVISIDANPAMIRRLSENATLSELDNIHIVHAGVSDQNGFADLMIRKGDEAIVRIEENTNGKFPVRTLQDIVTEFALTRIDALKIDIEGHEDKALVPYFEAVDDAMLPQKIVIENPSSSTRYEGCVAVFEARGYRVVGRSRNNSFYEKRV